MFKELTEGQTHSYNDGCGDINHNCCKECYETKDKICCMPSCKCHQETSIKRMGWREEIQSLHEIDTSNETERQELIKFIETLLERVIADIENWKVIEYPKMKTVSCEQAFIAGQLNMLMRIPNLRTKFLGKENK